VVSKRRESTRSDRVKHIEKPTQSYQKSENGKGSLGSIKKIYESTGPIVNQNRKVIFRIRLMMHYPQYHAMLKCLNQIFGAWTVELQIINAIINNNFLS